MSPRLSGFILCCFLITGCAAEAEGGQNMARWATTGLYMSLGLMVLAVLFAIIGFLLPGENTVGFDFPRRDRAMAIAFCAGMLSAIFFIAG